MENDHLGASSAAEHVGRSVVADPLYCPNGVQWVIKEDGIPIDPAQGERQHEPYIHWPCLLRDQPRRIVDHFYLMYPMVGMPTTLRHINECMDSKGKQHVSKGEFIKWLGLRVAMAAEPRRGPITVYWQHSFEEGTVFSPADYGTRFGMSRHRFQDITSALSFAPLKSASECKNDPWYPIRPFVEAFNATRYNNITPGYHLTVDECMSAWNGSDGKYRHDGMPHKTKIPRKPEGVGAEMKSLCCGITGIMLKLDIMEGKDRQAAKPFCAEYGEGTAITLQLTQGYFGSSRVVHADSAFSSVKTLEALKIHGLRFMGIVKTATKGYPKRLLTMWAAGELEGMKPNRGDHILLEATTVRAGQFYACGWADKKPKFIISNCGSTNPGQPSIRPRHRREVVNGEPVTVAYEKSVKRPHMIELFFEHFSVIDVHDHLRQGSLAMEREWYTHCWWHRMFGTVFGICIVDAYMVYKYESEQAFSDPQVVDNFTAFIGKLSHQLIFNEFLEDGRMVRRHSNEEKAIEEVNMILLLDVVNLLFSLSAF